MSKELSLSFDQAQFKSFERALSFLNRGFLQNLLKSVEPVRGKGVIFDDGEDDQIPLGGWDGGYEWPEVREVPCTSPPRLIVSIDSSVVLLGSSREGRLLGVKIGIGASGSGRALWFGRMGPTLAYLDDGTTGTLIGRNGHLARLVLADEGLSARMLRVYAERATLLQLAQNLSDATILTDGPAQPSLFEGRESSLFASLSAARSNGSMILGISKSSYIGMLDGLPWGRSPPTSGVAYVDATALIKEHFGDCYGRVLLVRFKQGFPAFRVDCGKMERREFEDGLASVAVNDDFHHGYPESLRMAHYCSIFSRSDLLVLRAYATSALNLLPLPSVSLRGLTLGQRSWG